MKISDMIGKQIFSPEGEWLGYVKGAYVSRDGARVTAYDCSDEEEEVFYLPARAVRAVNDVVIAQNKKSQSVIGIAFPVGKEAYSHLGERMGHIVDFCVESGVLTVKGEEDELYISVGAVSFGKSVIIYPSEEEKQALRRARKKPSPKKAQPPAPPLQEERREELPQGEELEKTLPSVREEESAISLVPTARELPAPVNTPSSGAIASPFPLHRLDLLGRTVRKNVYDAQGYLLVSAGERITPDTVMHARRNNRLLQLAVNTITNL